MEKLNPWFEDLLSRGPKDIYEVIAITHYANDAVHILCIQNQVKDNIILSLTQTLNKKIGHGYWTRYTKESLQGCEIIKEISAAIIKLGLQKEKET